LLPPCPVFLSQGDAHLHENLPGQELFA